MQRRRTSPTQYCWSHHQRLQSCDVSAKVAGRYKVYIQIHMLHTFTITVFLPTTGLPPPPPALSNLQWTRQIMIAIKTNHSSGNGTTTTARRQNRSPSGLAFPQLKHDRGAACGVAAASYLLEAVFSAPPETVAELRKASAKFVTARQQLTVLTAVNGTTTTTAQQ